MTKSKSVGRRRFLKGVAAGGAALVTGRPLRRRKRAERVR